MAVVSQPRIRYAESPELLVIHRCSFCLIDTHLDDNWLICPVCGTRWPLDREGMVDLIDGGELYQDWAPHPHPKVEPSDPVEGIAAGVDWETERRERIIANVMDRLGAGS